MNLPLLIPLAEITAPDLASFEQRLGGQFGFILALYGAVFAIGLCLLIAFTLRIQSQPLDWTGPVRRLEWRPWSLADAARIIVPLILLQIIFAALISLVKGADYAEQEGSEKVLLILQSLLFHWTGFLLVVTSLYRRRLTWLAGFGLASRGAVVHAVWGVLILLGVMPLVLGYNIVAHMVMEWMGHTPEVQDVTRIITETSGPAAKLYLALLALVIAPVVEEILFRGVLLPAFTRAAGVKPAIVAVSLLFAMVHGHWPSFVPLFMLSVALCLAYIYRGSLVVSMAMHACFNGLTVAVILKM